MKTMPKITFVAIVPGLNFTRSNIIVFVVPDLIRDPFAGIRFFVACAPINDHILDSGSAPGITPQALPSPGGFLSGLPSPGGRGLRGGGNTFYLTPLTPTLTLPRQGGGNVYG